MLAYIRHIPPSLAGGRLAHVYKEIRSEVPRVPNLMQVFSLRPETMAGIYRSWLANMWNGRVARQTKELLALAVSRAADCDYCVDAHLVFLQAAGMDRAQAHDIERMLADSEALGEREREAVRFGIRMTEDPRSVTAGECESLRKAWPEEEERTEIISVIAAFNTITRICNALGVALEIPPALRRFDAGRRGAIALMSRLTAIGVDLSSARPLAARSPEENRRDIESLFRAQLGFGAMPPGFNQLESCPEVFDGQLRLMEKAVAVVPRDRWMRVGLVVGRLTGCRYIALNCGAWLDQRGVEAAEVIAASEGVSTSLPDVEQACLRYVRDLTLYSHAIDEKRVDGLRMVGLSDGAILDLAFVGGLFNGVARLIMALAPLEENSARTP